jgi:uncharacterized protein (DUF58 family)
MAVELESDWAGVRIKARELSALKSVVDGIKLPDLFRLQNQQAGSRQARIKGRGMEYEESRAYVVGDEIKTMDWRVMARTGEAHTKQFSEQKERSVLIAVDFSSSLFFGTQHCFKSYAIARLAGLVAWIAAASGVQMSALVADQNRCHLIKPRTGIASLSMLFEQLDSSCAIDLPVTGDYRCLNALLSKIKRFQSEPSQIILLSDFLGLDDASLKLMQSLCLRHQVLAFQVTDQIECDPWQSGHYPVSNKGVIQSLNLNNQSTRTWLDNIQRRHAEDLTEMADQLSFDLKHISASQDIDQQFKSVMSEPDT